jgi:hypothetical protein
MISITNILFRIDGAIYHEIVFHGKLFQIAFGSY